MRALAAGVVVAVAAAVAGCGQAGPAATTSVRAPDSRERPPVSTDAAPASVPAPVEPVVVAPDPAAAAAIAIDGARPSEEAAIREVLARLGSAPPVTSVEVADDSVYGRTMRLVVPHDRADDSGLVYAAGGEMVARTAGDPTPIAALGVDVEGRDAFYPEPVEPAPGPRRTADEVGELVRAVEDRAASAGFDLARLEGYAIGSGIVVATIRYGEAEFAHGPTDWHSRLAPDVWDEGREYTAFVDIRVPDQEPLEAARARGATHLVFSVSMLLDCCGAGDRLQRVVLDCDGGASEAVADPGALCDRLIADRYDLLPLVSSDFTCAGNPNDTASVTGTLVGEPFERVYDHCDGYAHTLEELLGIRRLAPAAPAACLDAWNASADRRAEAVASEWGDVRITVGTTTSGGTEVAACEYVLGSTRPMRFEAPLADHTAGPIGAGKEWPIEPNGALPRSATVDAEGRLLAIAPTERTLDDCVGAWNFAGVGGDAGLGINSYEEPLAAAVAVAADGTCTVDVDGRRVTGRWDADGLRWADPEPLSNARAAPNADLAGGDLRLRPADQ